jgi:hypothetical protein
VLHVGGNHDLANQTMKDVFEGPVIGSLRLDGILDKTGRVPAGGDTLCFQVSRCGR